MRNQRRRYLIQGKEQEQEKEEVPIPATKQPPSHGIAGHFRYLLISVMVFDRWVVGMGMTRGTWRK